MTSPTPRTDLSTRIDVEALLRHFYGRAMTDDVLYEPFAPIRAMGLDAHLPVMCDFWETVLFGSGAYEGSVFRIHLHLHEQYTLTTEHFGRWLALWIVAVDERHDGPIADRAKLQANRMASAMSRRLCMPRPTDSSA